MRHTKGKIYIWKGEREIYKMSMRALIAQYTAAVQEGDVMIDGRKAYICSPFVAQVFS